VALEEPQEGDILLERSGIPIAVAGPYRIYFEHSVLDYEESAFGGGLILRPSSTF